MDDLIITAEDTLPIVEEIAGTHMFDLVLQGGNGQPDFHIEGLLSELQALNYKISMALREVRS